MDDVTDTWLGRAIRGAAADAARRPFPGLPSTRHTDDELEEDRRERRADLETESEEEE